MMISVPRILIWSMLGANALAGPLVVRTSTKWKDPYIAAPTDFKVTKIQKCSYQITFRRDIIDSRYSYGFEAVYGSREVAIQPVEGGLPISRTIEIFTTYSPTGRYQINDDYVLSVHHFKNACSNGTPPSAFRIRAILPEDQYTYKNRYRTAPILATQDSVPAVPQNVKVKKSSAGYTVTWDGVQDASGYFALASGTYPNSEVGDVWVIYTNLLGAAGRNATFNERTESVAVVARGADGVVSRTDKVPELPVPE